MDHRFSHNENFNILTAKREKGHLIFTGEAKEPLAVGDLIDYTYGDMLICHVDVIKERRDSKDYPKGNGYFYKCEYTGVAIPVSDPK